MKNLKKAIEKNDFEDAESLLKKYMILQVVNMIEEQAFRTGNISYYIFIDYLAKKNNDSYLHFVASNLLLNYYDDTLALDNVIREAFCHAQKATELAIDNTEYKEHLLQFYEFPKKSPQLSVDDAIKLCDGVLVKEPDNQMFKEIYTKIIATKQKAV